MRPPPLGFLLGLIAGPAVLAAAASATRTEFDLPPGFEISVYSTDQLAHDITAMTVDTRGRVVVAGPGYIKTLHDDNGDGLADRAAVFSRVPATGAHGLCATPEGLLVSGDKAIMRLRDADGDGVADGAPEILRADQDSREHGTHAIKQGPDGWYYVMIGNAVAAGAYRGLTEESPVRQVKQGALLRFSPDFRQAEAVAHGFRNAYDFDFTADGRILTVDSDGERVHHLPGYAPTRLFDVAVGGHHGWMVRASSRAWSRESYSVDGVERAIELGRGSPTGVVTYRHAQFPDRYRAGVFSACWSLGTVYFIPLREHGSTFAAEREVFLQARGNDGFAPSALAVHPDGDLLVAIGGRSTRGGVYRVRYAGGEKRSAAVAGLDAVLDASQPLSGWSRERWVPLARGLSRAELEEAALSPGRAPAQRIRALEILVELHDGISPATVKQLAASPEPGVVARLAWVLGRMPAVGRGQDVLAELTRHPSVLVQRASWEALLGKQGKGDTAVPDWARGVTSPDRRVRAAAVEVARRWGVRDFATREPLAELAQLRIALPNYADPPAVRTYFEKAIARYEQATDPAIKLEAIETMQIALGDISITEDRPEWLDIGYNGVHREKLGPELRQRIASVLLREGVRGLPPLVRERTRLLGMLQENGREVTDLAAEFWNDATSPVDDLHFLFVTAQIPGTRSDETLRRTARALASLHAKMDARQWLASTYWPVRVTEAFQRLLRFDGRMADALAAEPAFGRADHSVFVAKMEGESRRAAARKLLATAERSRAWNPGLVELIGATLPPSETRAALRRQQSDPALREAIAVALAREPEAADRRFLMESLMSVQGPIVPRITPALQTPPVAPAAGLVLLIKGLARHERDQAAAGALQAVLTRWTGPEGAGVPPTAAGWMEWLSLRHPAEAAALRAELDADPGEVLRQMEGVAWGLGNSENGLQVYQQRGCYGCHEGARLGPDLRGIAARFSREDLFLHIVKPNLAISPAYRALQVTLKDGTVHVGEAVYDSPEALLLEVAAGTTIRLTGAEIVRTEPARRSPMPEGLLAGLKRSELADLYAYLRSLK